MFWKNLFKRKQKLSTSTVDEKGKIISLDIEEEDWFDFIHKIIDIVIIFNAIIEEEDKKR